MGKENRRGLFGSSRPLDPIAEGPSKEDIVAFGQPEYDNQSGLALFTQKFSRGTVAVLGLSASSVALEACALPRVAQVRPALEQNSSATKLTPIAEAPTSTSTPTHTPTVVFTVTATETSTPTPSLTPTATEQATATPEKSYSDRFLAAFKEAVSRVQTAIKENRLREEAKAWENAGPGTLERVSFAKDTLREAQNESDQLTRGMIVDFAFMNLVLVDAGYNPEYAEFQSEEARQELGVQSTLMREMFLALALTPEQTQKMSDLELSGLVVRILAETKEFQKQFSKLPEEWQDKKVESITAKPVATATPAPVRPTNTPARPTNTPAPSPTRPVSTPIPRPEFSPTVTLPERKLTLDIGNIETDFVAIHSRGKYALVSKDFAYLSAMAKKYKLKVEQFIYERHTDNPYLAQAKDIHVHRNPNGWTIPFGKEASVRVGNGVIQYHLSLNDNIGDIMYGSIFPGDQYSESRRQEIEGGRSSALATTFMLQAPRSEWPSSWGALPDDLRRIGFTSGNLQFAILTSK